MPAVSQKLLKKTLKNRLKNLELANFHGMNDIFPYVVDADILMPFTSMLSLQKKFTHFHAISVKKFIIDSTDSDY
jgi:hypothetical protein